MFILSYFLTQMKSFRRRGSSQVGGWKKQQPLQVKCAFIEKNKNKRFAIRNTPYSKAELYFLNGMLST